MPDKKDETPDEARERFQRIAEEEETRAAARNEGNLPGGKPGGDEPRLDR